MAISNQGMLIRSSIFPVNYTNIVHNFPNIIFDFSGRFLFPQLPRSLQGDQEVPPFVGSKDPSSLIPCPIPGKLECTTALLYIILSLYNLERKMTAIILHVVPMRSLKLRD